MEANMDHMKLWTKEEKFELLQAIKTFSSKDIEHIRTRIPTKGEEDIKKAIEYYKLKALRHPKISMNKRKINNNVNNLPRIPLVMWAKRLQESLSFNDLHTETVTALRLIADLEDIPRPSCTGNIDFRKAYHALADAMEGKSLPDDKKLVALLENCIIDTALTAKAFIKPTDLLHLLSNINLSESEINVFPKPTDDHELAALRHLASLRSYNPLNIPEHFLKQARNP